MKKLTIYLLSLMFLAFVACDDAKKGESDEKDNKDTDEQVENQFADPIEYNDYIVEQQDKLMQLILELNEYAETDDMEVIEEALGRLQDQAQESLDAIKEMEGYDGNTEMRDAAEDLFTFYNDLFNNEYVEMINLITKEDATEEDYNQVLEIQAGIADKEGALDEAFLGAQRDFASEHGFDLTPNPYQDDFENMGGEWSDVEREAFLESCMAGLEGNDMIDGESYCNCMLEKLEATFSNAIEAQSMTAEEMQEWAMDCL